MADDAAVSVPMTFSEPLETLDSIPRKSQMLKVTARPGSSHMRLGSQKPQTHEQVQCLPPDPMPDQSHIQQSTHVEPVSFNLCISHPKLITI